ncbi:MAG: twin-arginine translocase TatA/TatE family subunit [Chloroflexi bacterium]|nr:twin-arginine translocase TatA/TatE family subunit [Chloroflexota bacterium]OQB02472.1 MAG: twin arginine translocase protein A [Chloroflexi bacterium ADurb.Bin222]HOC20308.1 twin-arginine translocase TatA/TatE family subunit [Anaerolineae bacterium]HOS79360.1 twin-arginine translocase TatA/TatE family subunit [Anaerolineae bacterium]HQJ10780.1 twin-arginine translocase TatA/TatE family subunit [Anaerolineae bacterium]
MLPRIGLPEIIVVLVIALLIFGPGRITKVAGELGKSIHAFQHGLKEQDKPADESQHDGA